MRDPRELLGLLTAKIQRFQLAPGGIPFLTQSDVAAALSYIGKYNSNAALYARFKYLKEYDRAEDLVYRMRLKVMQDLIAGDWKIPREGFLLDLCYLALAEAVDPHSCTWCLGRESVLVDKAMAEEALRETRGDQVRIREGQVIVCSQCRGTGKRTIKDADRTRIMAVRPDVWSRQWRDKYKDIQVHTVDKWEDIVGALRPRLA